MKMKKEYPYLLLLVIIALSPYLMAGGPNYIHSRSGNLGLGTDLTTADPYLDIVVDNDDNETGNHGMRVYANTTSGDYMEQRLTGSLGGLYFYDGATARLQLTGDSDGVLLYPSGTYPYVYLRTGTSPGMRIYLDDDGASDTLTVFDDDGNVLWRLHSDGDQDITSGTTAHTGNYNLTGDATITGTSDLATVQASTLAVDQDGKITQVDGTSTGPFIVTYPAVQLIQSSLSEDSVGTGGVNGTVATGQSTLIFDWPLPNRENGGKVVVDRITVGTSGIAVGDTYSFYIMGDHDLAWSPTIQVASYQSSDDQQVLSSDFYAQDDGIYYVKIHLDSGDGVNDTEVETFQYEYHLE